MNQNKDKSSELGDLFESVTGEEEVVEKQEEQSRREPDDEEDADRALPTIDEECPDCGHETAYYYLQQTRAADESETRFYICKECDNKWRGYD